MKKYYIITYRLTRKVKPSEVLAVIENLMEKYALRYKTCKFHAEVSIIEFEHAGKFHSNRHRNGVLSILKKYPELEAFFAHTVKDMGDGIIHENVKISNASGKGIIDPAIAFEITKKIPRPYSIDNLVLTLDGVSFPGNSDAAESLRESKDGCVGNYIHYSREVHGSEYHSYLIFSADDSMLENMRKFFFDCEKQLPGRYQGTEIKNG